MTRRPQRVSNDAYPVETYADCRCWLYRYVNSLELQLYAFHDGPAPACALLICDLFWVSDQQLRADIRKDWREVGA